MGGTVGGFARWARKVVAAAAGGGGFLGMLVGLWLAVNHVPGPPDFGQYLPYLAAGFGMGCCFGILAGMFVGVPALIPFARKQMLFAYRAGHDEMRQLVRDVRKDLRKLGDVGALRQLDDILAKDAQLRRSATTLWMRLARVAGSGGKWVPDLDDYADNYRRHTEQNIATLEHRMATTTDVSLRRELEDALRIHRSGLDTFVRVQTAIQRIEAPLQKNRTALETILLKIAHATHLEQRLTERLSPDVSGSLNSFYEEINAFDTALRDIMEQPTASPLTTPLSASQQQSLQTAEEERQPPRQMN